MKERLTGAIILVALIVLLVPELLTGPIRSAPRAVAASAEEPPLRSYTINLGDDAHARTAAAQPDSAPAQPATSPAPVPAAASAESAPQAPGEGPAPPAGVTPEPQPAQPAPTPKPKPDLTRAAPAKAQAAHAAIAPPAPEAGGTWMVQLGSFASRANAERLAQQLKGQGFSASVSQGSGGRHLYRVRAGPVHDRAAAGQLQAKLKSAGHSGSVVAK